MVSFQTKSADCTFRRSCINFIGPWKVKVNGRQVEFNAMICIDMASTFAEDDKKTAEHIHGKFTQSWLC